jgi:hypothetical protein
LGLPETFFQPLCFLAQEDGFVIGLQQGILQLEELCFKGLFLLLELSYLLFEYFFEFSTAFEEGCLVVVALLLAEQIDPQFLLLGFGGF